MRKLFISFLLLFSLCFVLLGQIVVAQNSAVVDDAYFRYEQLPDHFYMNGSKVEVAVRRSALNHISVKYEENVSQAEKNSLAATASVSAGNDLSQDTQWPISVFRTDSEADAHTIVDNLSVLRSDNNVVFAYPALSTNDGQELLVTDQINVKFKQDVGESEIENYNRSNQVAVVDKYVDSTYTLRLRNPRASNAITVANKYYESGLTDFAMPNFIAKATPAVIPNDTYYWIQWSLNNNGNILPGTPADADVDAPEAWELNKGSTAAPIAILDEGVDAYHPDLAGKISVGLDEILEVQGPYAAQPDPADEHGTACAGIAAAVTNNSLGITGMSWYSTIIPVRIATSGTGWLLEDAKVAHATSWASQAGAKVISNSWSYHSETYYPDVLKQAILNAKGQGSVVIFAAGNDNNQTPGTGVTSPAVYNDVIAVGATNLCDQRKVRSGDNCNNLENGWSSRFGPALDISAPGVRMPTLDNVGANGGNGTDYLGQFNGTSAATPLVAGIASLIISQNPSLTQDQVEYILLSNAEDKGSPGKDDEYGFGRANAYYALKPDINYLMPWYDQQTPGMTDWILVANPNINTSTLNSSISIGPNHPNHLKDTFALAPGQNATPSYPGVTGGPVKAASADGTTTALFSQRSLFNNNFNETMGIPESKLETEYYFTWYDNFTTGMETWILVGNRGNVDATVQIDIGTASHGPYQVAPDEILPFYIDNIMGGPVRVRSTNNQKLLVSERTIYQGAFNEMMGIPASTLTSEYGFTWYDYQSPGFIDWVLIANMGDVQAHVEVYIQDMTSPAYSYDIAPGTYLTPSFQGIMGGPVKVKCTNDQPIIASQRTLYHGRFEEVAGTSASALGSSAWFTWYDTTYMQSWIHLSNTSDSQTATADLYLAGQKLNTSGPITVNPETDLPLYYGGKLGGPVEVRTLSGPNLLVSQRALWGSSFNELVGATLSS